MTDFAAEAQRSVRVCEAELLDLKRAFLNLILVLERIRSICVLTGLCVDVSATSTATASSSSSSSPSASASALAAGLGAGGGGGASRSALAQLHAGTAPTVEQSLEAIEHLVRLRAEADSERVGVIESALGM